MYRLCSKLLETKHTFTVKIKQTYKIMKREVNNELTTIFRKPRGNDLRAVIGKCKF